MNLVKTKYKHYIYLKSAEFLKCLKCDFKHFLHG
jgi:hypothetical protein